MLSGKARAHTNIALIKYWGKANEEYILPMNSSLSLTLDAFYTETTVTFDAHYSEDVFILDGILQNENKQKVKEFLNLVRQQADCTWFAKVESQNFVPTAAGFGFFSEWSSCFSRVLCSLRIKSFSKRLITFSATWFRFCLSQHFWWFCSMEQSTLMKRRLLKIFQPIIGKTNLPCSLS